MRKDCQRGFSSINATACLDERASLPFSHVLAERALPAVAALVGAGTMLHAVFLRTLLDTLALA